MKWRKPSPLKQVIHNEETEVSTPPLQDELVGDISMTEQVLRNVFQNCSDIVFRSVFVNWQTKMLLVYVDGLVDTKVLDQVFLKPMVFDNISNGMDKVSFFKKIVEEQLIAIAQVTTVYKVSEVVEGVLKANLAILTDGVNEALIADLKGFQERAIEEPSSEISLRGPRDGFTETLRVNTSLLRRKLRTPLLKIESSVLGKISHTDIAIAYIEGVAKEPIVEEVRTRVNRIQIDGLLATGFLEDFIEDATFTPFPQVQDTERPDVAVSNLLEGRVAILVDGTSHVSIVPFTFWAGLQSVDDYYERTIYSTTIRWLRYILFIIALLLPSVYVASTSFNSQLIPVNLLLSIAAAREGVPFPIFVEALIMEVMFEALREAGLRMPKPMGSAVSIVGALVIGQAAVQAGIVSAPIVMVVAITGIASLSIPRYNLGTALRLLRFPMLILAGTIGFFGIAIGIITIIIHLVNLRSFGVPYFTPIAPQVPGNLKDVLIRAPRWSMGNLPELVAGNNKQRIPKGQKPTPKR